MQFFKCRKIYIARHIDRLLPARKYLCRETRGPHIGWSWSTELRAAPNDNPRRPEDCCCRRRWPRWPLACCAPSCSPACYAVAAVVAAAAVEYDAAILQYCPPHSRWRSGLPGRHHYLPSTKFFSVGGIYLIQKYLDVKRSSSMVDRGGAASSHQAIREDDKNRERSRRRERYLSLSKR